MSWPTATSSALIWVKMMLEVAKLSVSYGKHIALSRATMTVEPGEIVVILGANGAGKTTLLKSLAGLVRKEAGSRVLFHGTNIGTMPPHHIVEAGLALVPEGRSLFGDLTVRENLELGSFAKRARSGEKHQFNHVLDLFPRLAERLGQIARTMSGGEQQMLAIGRALMSKPDILLLDEPSLGLAPIVTKDLFRTLARIREDGTGILLVEQNTKKSLEIADRGFFWKTAKWPVREQPGRSAKIRRCSRPILASPSNQGEQIKCLMSSF
jgi:branched-chain amino acid transport system ATP-binding protein